ncbi:S24 family peptidase [Notoacmeibacter ruber]|uniref:Helix-turn-helix transcriptional regulator n=1 Tax=Notoacmeibacter ruber TaxID=2670375 RepID=A0A3L7J9Z1_9HYPH|nr:helix-turn-helix transcriptional regulator [Notoacmeibacter ruber]RLQ87175.1 helix-turn-helix transcriptional regulator [Notoacmeibacter ruber]
MKSHANVWKALDRLAAEAGLSPSALARRSGLDPTTFNPSKRVSKDGRNRWPSTESIFKVLHATDRSISDFADYVGEADGPVYGGMSDQSQKGIEIPMLGFAEAGGGGWFDDAGYPAGEGLETISFPAQPGDDFWALQVHGDSMEPIYRSGDRLIISPSAPLRLGDRVVARTRQGEVMAKVLARYGDDGIDLYSFNSDHPPRSFVTGEVEWVARIVWASQ